MNVNKIKISSNNITTIGSYTENTSSKNVSFKSDGEIICNEILEAPVFTSSKEYSYKDCENYCTRNSSVNWANSDIKESKGNWWTNGNIICLVIPCSDKTFFVGYHKVIDGNNLQPLSKYKIQSNATQNMIIGKDKKIYFNEFIETKR